MKAEDRPETHGFFDRFRQRGDQMRAIEFTGQRIVPRKPHELFVAGVALVVDADDALRAHRLAVGPCKPATGLLDPDHRRGGRGPHAIFDPVGDAFAAPRRRRLSERLGPDRTGGLDQPGEPGAAGQRLRRNVGEDRAGIVAPGDGVRPSGPRRRPPDRARQGCWRLAGQGASGRLDSGHRRVIPTA